MEEERNGALLVLGFSGTVTVASFIWLSLTLREAFRLLRQKSWPRVIGWVTRELWGAIDYEYEAEGTRYPGHHLGAFEPAPLPGDARELLHHRERPLWVHYDPQRPESSTLTPGSGIHELWIPFIGPIVFIAAATGIVWLWWTGTGRG